MHGLVIEEERILKERGRSGSLSLPSRRNWDTRSNVSSASTTIYSFRSTTSSKSGGSICYLLGLSVEKKSAAVLALVFKDPLSYRRWVLKGIKNTRKFANETDSNACQISNS